MELRIPVKFKRTEKGLHLEVVDKIDNHFFEFEETKRGRKLIKK